MSDLRKAGLLLTAAVAATGLFLAGCASKPAASPETAVADQVARAIYNDDVSGVTSNFTTNLASQVTRASVGALSDKMHALGTYQGLTETAIDIPSRRYTFDAKFDKGDMTVGMRLDANGKVLAYRVVPGTSH
jgi:outer membrane murein-binding lipoprotein Lpp